MVDEKNTIEEFRLDSIEDIAKFEELLKSYHLQKLKSLSQNIRTASLPISLTNAYSKLQNYAEGGKIFAALLDIVLTYQLMEYDMNDYSLVFSQSLNKGTLTSGSVLDSEAIFFSRIEMHHALSNFIFRCRALWDKIMGIVIMMFYPDKYTSYLEAKSRKKIFKTILQSKPENSPIEPVNVEMMFGWIADLDNKFRTPEAHYTGRLRKFSFAMNELSAENPFVEMLGMHNAVNLVVHKLEGFLTLFYSTIEPTITDKGVE